MTVIPLSLAEANELVRRWHRHHTPVVGHKFSIGVEENGMVVGAAIVGRPVARHRDDGWTLEVTRLVTDGTKNACSKLYAAAWQAAKGMGYRRLGTYILSSEDGTSLKAAGWKFVHQTSGGEWQRSSRARVTLNSAQKQLWEARLMPAHPVGLQEER